MPEKIYIDKCVNCNGKGYGQIFDKKLNRWVRSDIPCRYCKGEGTRKFLLIVNGYDFMKRKIYLDNK